MKKTLILLLSLVLVLGLAFPAAATEETVYVVDEMGHLAPEELAQLNARARELHQQLDIALFFVFTQLEDPTHFDVQTLTAGVDDYFVMVESPNYWFTFYAGKALGALTQEDEWLLRDAYDIRAEYGDGALACLEKAAELLADAPDPISAQGHLFDRADLLGPSEEAELTALLERISGQWNAQLAVVTVPHSGVHSVDDYDDYIYDSVGFGYGEDRDGVLLLVCMDPREYRILSNGYPGQAIDPGVIDKIGDVIVSDLSDGNYLSAFTSFALESEYYLDGYLNGFPFALGKNLLIALAVGLVVGLVVVSLLKAQLKTVRKNNRATDYVTPGSLVINTKRDLFLYRNVTRTKIESSKSSSSGSSRSSGGGSF